MTMSLYKLFCCNVEVQYKGALLSKATFFTLFCTALNVILPFIIAYRSRGFWLLSDKFYEQPKVNFAYEYLLVAETEDPSKPIVCGEGTVLNEEMISDDESCHSIKMREYDYNKDGTNDLIELTFNVIVSSEHAVNSLLLIIGLHYQLKTICPLQMQSLAVITKEFAVHPSTYKLYGDLKLYQASHLPCAWNKLDTTYNYTELRDDWDESLTVNNILERYYSREVVTNINPAYSRTEHGHSGLIIKVSLRIPQNEVLYRPSVMQELKWAWPQYLSLTIIFHWILDRLKSFVFRNRLLMAWKEVPWKQ